MCYIHGLYISEAMCSGPKVPDPFGVPSKSWHGVYLLRPHSTTFSIWTPRHATCTHRCCHFPFSLGIPRFTLVCCMTHYFLLHLAHSVTAGVWCSHARMPVLQEDAQVCHNSSTVTCCPPSSESSLVCGNIYEPLHKVQKTVTDRRAAYTQNTEKRLLQ